MTRTRSTGGKNKAEKDRLAGPVQRIVSRPLDLAMDTCLHISMQGVRPRGRWDQPPKTPVLRQVAERISEAAGSPSRL